MLYRKTENNNDYMNNDKITLTCIVPVKNDNANIKNFLNKYYDAIRTGSNFNELLLMYTPSEEEQVNEDFYQILSLYSPIIPGFKCYVVGKGISHARNEGIDKATSEYVTFMDADWEIGGSLVTFLRRNDVNTIYNITNTTIYESDNKNISGCIDIFNLKDMDTSFVVIKKKDCHYFDEELEFGEDRVFYNELRRKGIQEINSLENGRYPYYNIRRYNSLMNFSKFTKRYFWYGRTMNKYVDKTKDYKMLIYVLGYCIICLLGIFNPFILMIPFLKGFFVSSKKLLKANKSMSFTKCILSGLIEILVFYCISLGFIYSMIKR